MAESVPQHDRETSYWKDLEVQSPLICRNSRVPWSRRPRACVAGQGAAEEQACGAERGYTLTELKVRK